jgi:hypothetical protein
MPNIMTLLACVVVALLALPGCSGVKEPGPETAQDVLGVWAAVDHDGDLFDIVIYPNGTAVTNWSKGPDGAKGQMGKWKATAEGIDISYPDGWKDKFKRSGTGFMQEGYAPGARKEAIPMNTCRPIRVTEPRARYVGVWETPDRDSGKPLYIAVFSDGTAKKTNPRNAKGLWSVQYGNAWFTWEDGWHNRIVRTETKFVDQVWRPTETPEMTQPAILAIKRVGDPQTE